MEERVFEFIVYLRNRSDMVEFAVELQAIFMVKTGNFSMNEKRATKDFRPTQRALVSDPFQSSTVGRHP